jgi:hypothetical protein
MGGNGAETLRLVVTPADDFFKKSDERWQAELFDLQQVLEREVGSTVEPVEVTEGKKGIELVEVILTLGSAGAFTAAVEAFKVWMGKKPDQRKLDVTWQIVEDEDGGRSGHLRVDATNVDSADVAAVANNLPKT